MYKRQPEVLSHIAEIRNYLESEAPMLPNAIVVAFDSRAKFRPCLLYTSDAADERSSVDLGGRRIIKKKKNKKIARREIA